VQEEEVSMVISNAKYTKKVGGLKNRAYMAGLDDEEAGSFHADSGTDFHEWAIPRYEEMKFLSIEELTS
jgi:hypothetical protein